MFILLQLSNQNWIDIEISYIFESGLLEFDQNVAFVNINSLANLLNQDTTNRNIEVYLKSPLEIENAKIESNVSIGPYARIRPGVHLESGAKVGNFVEVKKSTIGKISRT
mgnify:CR=1 FL=1